MRLSSVAGRCLGDVHAWAASSIAASCPALFGQPRRIALCHPAATCCCSAGCCPQLAAPARSVFCPSFCLRSLMLLAARCTAALSLAPLPCISYPTTDQPADSTAPLLSVSHTPVSMTLPQLKMQKVTAAVD